MIVDDVDVALPLIGSELVEIHVTCQALFLYYFRIRFLINFIITGATRLRNVMTHNPMVMGDS
jgi:hypothetical protein